jgi:glucuronosyltransferase
MLRKFLLVFVLSSVEGSRILGIFPTPSISHQVVFQRLSMDLAARGHQLTVVTTHPQLFYHENVSVLGVERLSHHFKRLNLVELSRIDPVKLAEKVNREKLKMLDEFLDDFEVRKLKARDDDSKFDLIVLEYFNYLPLLALAEVHDCPVIGIVSMEAYHYIHEQMGNSANPLIHPDFYLPYLHGHLTLFERIKSMRFYLELKFFVQRKQEKEYEKLHKKHFENSTETIDDLKGRVQLLMTNTNPALGFIRPLLPNTIQLGFMHIEPPKPLHDSDLKTFLDSSKNGVIYMSLGSNVQSKDLSPEVMQIFLKVFGSLSYDVLWKFEADDLPNKPDNVMISKWTPQSDLLAHPKIKLFIMQGGQQSMEEAIDRTVPMIVIPFGGDQGANAKRMVRKGTGYHLDLHDLTESKLLDAINEMLKPKYKQNIIKLRELVYDQPMTSRERAVWWTEYVIRHRGAKHLEYPGRLVPFYQKYWLDFISIFLLGLTVAISLSVAVLRKISRVPKAKKE